MANLRKFDDPVNFYLRIENKMNRQLSKIAENRGVSKNTLINEILDENIRKYDK